jgi:hypothetical protein
MIEPEDRATAPRWHAECADLATAVAVAREAIGRGGTADLGSMAHRLAALLDAAVVAPGAEPEVQRLGLLGLAEEIEALGCTIAEEGRRCRDELSRGDASARAVAAYTKTTRF